MHHFIPRDLQVILGKHLRLYEEQALFDPDLYLPQYCKNIGKYDEPRLAMMTFTHMCIHYDGIWNYGENAIKTGSVNLIKAFMYYLEVSGNIVPCETFFRAIGQTGYLYFLNDYLIPIYPGVDSLIIEGFLKLRTTTTRADQIDRIAECLIHAKILTQWSHDLLKVPLSTLKIF